MDRRRFLATLPGVGLAGCLRLTDDDGGTPDQSTPPPTETQTRTDALMPPGLSMNGPTDSFFSIHKQELDSTSFHTEFKMGGRNSPNLDRQYDVANKRAVGSWTYTGNPVKIYRDPDQSLWRESLGQNYTYGKSRHPYSIDRLTWSRWLKPIVAAGTWNLPSPIQDDPPIWRVEADGHDEEGSLPGHLDGTYEALECRVDVDNQGVIHTLTAEFEATRIDGAMIQSQIEYQVNSLGEKSVSKPAWVSTAAQRWPRITAKLTDDRKYVEFTLTDGNAIEPQTFLFVYDAYGRPTPKYDLEKPITPGETVYLYRENTEGRTGKIARETRPSDAAPITLNGPYNMWAARADHSVHVYFGTSGIKM